MIYMPYGSAEAAKAQLSAQGLPLRSEIANCQFGIGAPADRGKGSSMVLNIRPLSSGLARNKSRDGG